VALVPLQCGWQPNFTNMKQKTYAGQCIIILSAFMQKYYSVIHYIIDNTTYFAYQNINRHSISHKSNYCSMSLHGLQVRLGTVEYSGGLKFYCPFVGTIDGGVISLMIHE